MRKDVFRLTVLLACAALATSRLGLIGHELVGHGGAALLCGARITDVRLFWFAGGWIRYRLPEPSFACALFITMAGIGLELVVGLALAVLARGATLGRHLVRGIGLALVVHATWYLATGAFHGFGDGLLLYRWLGSARIPVAIMAGLVTCAATFIGAREVIGALSSTVSRRFAGTLVAVVLAGGFHAALTIGELRLRRDPTYVETMKPERERVIARELATWERAQPQSVTPEAKRVEAAKIAQAHPTFPFVWILALSTALAGFLGIIKTKRSTPPMTISNALLVRFVVLAVASVALVIVLS